MSTNATTSTGEQSNITSTEFCAGKYKDFEFSADKIYCKWAFDTILCWPPTEAGTVAYQNCPSSRGLDPSKFAERKCGSDGMWEGKPGITQINNMGWTNYSDCYLPEVRELLRRMGTEREIKMSIAERTRTLEIVGFSLSLVALVISLVIFYRFRSLRNNRTRIHKNLFIAMVIQVLIRLTLYIDQAIIRWNGGDSESSSTISIENTPYLCEASYILLEYARTAMFLWMFIEGLYLHNVVTVSVFQGRFPIVMYALLGWGAPVLMTATWAVFTAIRKYDQKCWYGYNFTPYYWILEGPRLVVILLNFIFLLNIIRVLVVKLRQSHTSDVEQARKAVRAAFVLLPLLGITNILNMSEAPLDRSPLEFAIWSYITHFLTSFQGFFIAMIYCFLNGEVRLAILKSIINYMSSRGHHDWADRRQSYFSGYYPTNADSEQTVSPNASDSNRNLQPKPHQKPPPRSNWISLFFLKKRMETEPPPESVMFDISE